MWGRAQGIVTTSEMEIRIHKALRRSEMKNGYRKTMLLSGIFMLTLGLSGCAASRSDIIGAYTSPVEKNIGAEKVSVFFLFRHLEQEHGFDAAQKLKTIPVKDFANIFRDSLAEISNLKSYDTDTEIPTDVDSPVRRQQRDELRSSNDYTLEINILEESSFKQQCFSGTISLLTLTLVPMPYTWDYTINANLFEKSGKLIRNYQRRAQLNNWLEAFLIFAYPFYPVEGKREEIYSGFLHDVFRQIESEKVLKKP